MCWKHALSKMYAACVELDFRPNSLRYINFAIHSIS